MKKGIIWTIVIVLLVAIAGAAVAIGVTSCNGKNAGAGENNTRYEVLHLKDEYTIGKTILFSVRVTSDVELTELSYTLNNSDKQVLDATTGLNKDQEEPLGSGKYVIDSGTCTISTSEMTDGYYVFVIYAENEAGTTYRIGEPIVIHLKAAAQSVA